MSTLVATNIKHASSSSNNLVLNSNGSVTGAGKILQTVQVVKTDFFSTTSSNGTYADITGLNASITPSSSSNKILVMVSITGGSTNWTNQYKLLRGSTVLGLGDDIGGNRSRCTFSSHNAVAATDSTNTSSYTYLDSPSSTSSTNYKIQLSHRSSGTAWINRPSNTADYNWIFSGSSTITLQEVAA